MPLNPILANFDLSNLPDVIEKANKRTAENERRSYARTVANWSSENKPSFTRVVTKTYGGIDDFKITTDSDIYKWVDEGTDPHEITPNGPYALRIRGGQGGVGNTYEPKTKANQITSDGSGSYFSRDTFGESVTQSIEPRNFTKIILEKAPQRWEKAIDTEMKKYLSKEVK